MTNCTCRPSTSAPSPCTEAIVRKTNDPLSIRMFPNNNRRNTSLLNRKKNYASRQDNPAIRGIYECRDPSSDPPSGLTSVINGQDRPMREKWDDDTVTIATVAKSHNYEFVDQVVDGIGCTPMLSHEADTESLKHSIVTVCTDQEDSEETRFKFLMNHCESRNEPSEIEGYPRRFLIEGMKALDHMNDNTNKKEASEKYDNGVRPPDTNFQNTTVVTWKSRSKTPFSIPNLFSFDENVETTDLALSASYYSGTKLVVGQQLMVLKA